MAARLSGPDADQGFRRGVVIQGVARVPLVPVAALGVGPDEARGDEDREADGLEGRKVG